MTRVWLLPVLAGAVWGCSNESQTCSLGTHELTVWVSVSDVAGEVEVEVEIEPEPGAGSIELCPGRDHIEVNGVEASAVRVFGNHYYRVQFSAPEDHYTIDLVRKSSNSASIEVEVPPSFEITAPVAGATHSRAANLDVTWSPSWADSQIQVALLDAIGSTCVVGLGYFELADDVGSHLISGGALSSEDSAADCDLGLVLTRTSRVEHPAGKFAGGEVTAYVNRVVNIRSTP